MVKGDIYLIDLNPCSGSEQKGFRPAIIVSHNSFNKNKRWNSVTIIPLTSAKRWLITGPSTVLFAQNEYGLTKESAALAHQITTIDKSKCAGFIGKCSPEKLEEIEEAILNYLDIFCE